MSAEIGAISFIQATETLLSTDDSATLCWDATTLGGLHINEVHIQTTQQSFTLSIDALPGIYHSHLYSEWFHLFNIKLKI